MKKLILLLISCSLLTACNTATTRYMTAPRRDVASIHKVQTIAMAPDSGILGDAVAVELANRGYDVYDSGQTSKLFIRWNLNEGELIRPEDYTKFRDKGIDAYLTLKTVGGWDKQPQSASAKLISTYDGKIITGVSYQNGWGGAQTSMADSVMRQNIGAAAEEIAKALIKGIYNSTHYVNN